jgi:hypothetical protein
LALALIILWQGVFPVSGMIAKAAMAMPKHAMPSQCAHMDSMDMGNTTGNCCSPGADCCRIKTGVQPVVTWARSMPPRLAVTGLLTVEESIGVIAPHDHSFIQASDSSPPYTVSLYKAKNVFLI